MNRLPPYPMGDMEAWALQLVEYLQDRDTNAEAMPQPTALAHKIGDEKAIQDGLLMFDPSLGKVVVSIGGAWVALATVP